MKHKRKTKKSVFSLIEYFVFGAVAALLVVFVASITERLVPIVSETYVGYIAKNSVYRMNIYETKTDQLLGYGTGFVTKDGAGHIRIVTNSHVCVSQDDKYTIKLNDGRELHKIAFDQQIDLCTLELPETDKSESPLTISKTASIPSSFVWVYGYPLGGTGQLVEGVLGNQVDMIIPVGERDAAAPRTKCLNDDNNPITIFFCFVLRSNDLIQAKILPGNSGSPIMDRLGRVTGVIWGYDTQSFAGLAVPLKELRKILNYVE